jgi:hypothetical protein
LASTDISYATKVATVISNFRKAKTDFDGQVETLGHCSHSTQMIIRLNSQVKQSTSFYTLDKKKERQIRIFTCWVFPLTKW